MMTIPNYVSIRTRDGAQSFNPAVSQKKTQQAAAEKAANNERICDASSAAISTLNAIPVVGTAIAAVGNLIINTVKAGYTAKKMNAMGADRKQTAQAVSMTMLGTVGKIASMATSAKQKKQGESESAEATDQKLSRREALKTANQNSKDSNTPQVSQAATVKPAA